MSDETQQSTVGKTDLESAIDAAAEAVAVQAAEIGEIDGALSADGHPIGMDALLEVPVRVTVRVGRASLSLGELVKLGPGSLVPLDREAHEPADVLVNGKVIAQGEIVTIDNTYGVRITSVAKDS
ncbi:MAG: flagellar motor switch protein FliN [Planctomycetota bacterium]|nr:flagellar motor switch protein FliN [Planctomycetota bacterium]MEC8512318.1 flagellar motor switch protein FliN [Planctomycetota bacterium]